MAVSSGESADRQKVCDSVDKRVHPTLPVSASLLLAFALPVWIRGPPLCCAPCKYVDKQNVQISLWACVSHPECDSKKKQSSVKLYLSSCRQVWNPQTIVTLCIDSQEQNVWGVWQWTVRHSYLCPFPSASVYGNNDSLWGRGGLLRSSHQLGSSHRNRSMGKICQCDQGGWFWGRLWEVNRE